jgi:site-specific recombinase XerD
LSEEQLSQPTIRGYLGDAGLFLAFLDDHNIPIRAAQPSDVASFLSKHRQRYRRQHGHFPPDDTQWRCERTPGIHRLLALAQGHWPPTTDIDRRAAWFRRRLLKEKIDSESARKYEYGAKHFLAFLNRIALAPERVTQENVIAFLKDHLKSYRRTYKRAPSDIRGWQRGCLTGIHRYLRFVQGQWPPPPRQDLELDEYKQHLIGRAFNHKTIFDYCLHVRIFLDYLRTCGTSVGDVQPNDVEAFLRVALRMYRKRKPNRLNSLAWWRTVSRQSVRSFLRFRLGEWPPDETPAVVVRFRQHLKSLQYGAKVIVRNVWAVRRFVTYIGERGLALEVVQPADIEAFLTIQAQQFFSQHRRAPSYEAKWRSQFRAPIYMLLRMIYPQWPPPTPPGNAQERLQRKVCDGYAQWLVDVQGLSAATLCKNGDAARVFLQWLNENAGMGSLRRLSVKDIDAYLAWRLPDLRRATRVGVCSCLRSFLRYLHSAKRIDRDLAAAVSSPSLYQFEDIPRAFTEPQIEAVLETARRDRSPAGLRDYAMLLMLATYGLRSGEVLRLRLEDIQWHEERFRVRQSKTGVESFLPLMSTIGEALVAYLKEGRPHTERREVFLRVRAPFGPLAGPASFATVIRRRLQESGIEVKGRHGAHAFRFARALSLLRASVSPKWIGDLLGHRSSSSTQTYLRLATEDLRALSLEVPGRRK